MGTRISQFTALTAVASADYFPLVQDSDTTNKRVSLASLLASVPLGSAATPSIAFTGDLNTGIYSPGADQVAVATNGTGRLFVGSSGRIGIDTSTAASKFVVSKAGAEGIEIEPGDTSGVNLTRHYNRSSDAFVTSSVYAANHIFYRGVTEALRITSAGLVGIGTSAPSGARVHSYAGNGEIESAVKGEIAATVYPGLGTNIGGKFLAAGFGVRYGVWGEVTNTDWGAQYGGYFKAAGGTNDNAYGVYAETGSSNVGAYGISYAGYLKATSAGTGTNATIYGLRVENTATGGNTSYGALISTVAGPTTVIPFRVDHAGSEKLRLDSSGRLLIGTSSASSTATTLLLQGSPDGSTGASYLRLATGTASPGSTATIGQISFTDSGHSTAASIVAFRDGGTWTSGSSQPTILTFFTTADGASSPTERLRIQSDGILIKYGDTTSARIQPQTDNAGFLGEATKRWEAVYAVNGTIQTSDVREKTDIVDSPLGAEFIRSLRPVAYRWKVGGYTSTYDDKGNETITPNPGVRAHYGFIAQEVKQAIGETDFGGWLQEDLSDPDSQQSLRLHEFISPIVKALQEALDEIDNLKTEVAALKTA